MYPLSRRQRTAGRESALEALLSERQPDQIGRDGWKAIDVAEKTAGKSAGRPRVKFTSVENLLKAAKD
ncbi:hypothetical protein [Nocardia sp. NPDC004711]